MTTAVTPAAPSNTSNRGRLSRAGNPWRRLWQVPLLLAGLAVFGVGLRLLVKTIKPIPFETHVADVQNMLAAGKFADAVARINTLAGYYHLPHQQAVLEVLSGDTLYLAQLQQPAVVRANFEGVARHYATAQSLGFYPTVTMNERWGEAGMALGDPKMAVDHFEAAAKQNPAVLPAHVHDLVAAYLEENQTPKALAVVDRLLTTPRLSVDDRAWGLCRKIQIALADAGSTNAELPIAINTARAALPDIPELDPAGRVLTWIGRAQYESGDLAGAAESLRTARSKFIVHHLDDGRAALLLGKLDQAAFARNARDAAGRQPLAEAGALFQEVITSQAGTVIYAAARLGRAEVAVAGQGLPAGSAAASQPATQASNDNDQLLADYRFAIQAVTSGQPHAIGEGHGEGAPEFLTRDGLRSSLITAATQAASADHLELALSLASLQKDLGESETADDAMRMATMHESRARELLAAGGDAAKAGAVMLAQAADDYLRHSHLTTMDDAISGDSLWKAAGLLDEAGESQKSADAYERFVRERPRDTRDPEGLLAIGRLYQSMGNLDKAIAAYLENITKNPRTPASYASAVHLARCYMARGPQDFDKAEAALLSLVQDNSDLLPTAAEFRQSLFTLGELYYRNGRWADAILRLEEALTRYPDDPAGDGSASASLSNGMFMLAESYRRSAQDIGEAVKKDPAIAGRDALEQARAERYARASELFSGVIGRLDPQQRDGSLSPTPPTGLEGDYLRSAYMDRAACAYDLANYTDAIRLYDGVAGRFPDEVLAVEAYVQIVNAYLARGESTKAAAAAERARWILKRVPDEAFAKSPMRLSRDYYEKFLQLGAMP